MYIVGVNEQTASRGKRELYYITNYIAQTTVKARVLTTINEILLSA